MGTESVFYFPVTIHRQGLSAPIVAPLVNSLSSPLTAQDEAVILAADVGHTQQGLYVLASTWRFILPMPVISSAIIQGSSISIYLGVPDPVVMNPDCTIYRNGVRTADHVLVGDSLFGVVTPYQAPVPPPGPDFSLFTTVENVGGNRVVRVAIGGVAYADSANILHANLVVGVTMDAASAGTQVRVQTTGEMTEPSWNWTPGEPVFNSINGTLTQASPSDGYSLIVGQASGPQTMIISVKQPIILI